MTRLHGLTLWVLPALLLVLTDVDFAQTGTIAGRVHDNQQHPLPGANVLVLGSQRGAATDTSGTYVIRNVTPGSYTLRATMIGYEAVEHAVTVIADSAAAVDFQLNVAPVQGQEVNVSTQRKESAIEAHAAAEKVNIPAAELQRKSADQSVLSALSKEAGLTVQPSELCGASGVRMEGLEPSYAEITVDGMPVFSGLGALYGLQGVSVEDVSEVEVEKGSGASEAGSGAISGQVNLISQRPSNEPTLDVNINGGDTGQHTLSVAGSHDIGSIPARLSVTYGSQPGKVDRNHDGVTDTPEYRRVSASAEVASGDEDDGFRTGARIYEESRVAGETGWNTSHRGSADVYGRDILTHRQELSAKYAGKGSGYWNWSIESAFVNHRQNSWYGVTHYDAVQREALARISAQVRWNRFNTTNLQGTFDYNDYTDNLHLSAATALHYRIPSLMAQNTWTPTSKWMLQVGGRLEYYRGEGVIATPRGAVLWQPEENLSLRLSGGAGFRPVSIFSLDESVQAGFEHIIVPATLKPEHTLAGNLSVNKQWIVGKSVLSANVSLFYTHIPQKVILFYGPGPDTTTYANAQDAYSRGGEVQLKWAHVTGWSLSADISRADMRYEDALGWHQEPEENLYTGNASLMKTWGAPRITLELSSQIYGPRDLPPDRRRARTPAFALVDFGLGKTWGYFTLSALVQNLLDWTQPDSPYLRDPNTGKILFDSLLLYGPLLGRSFHASLSYSL